MRGLEEPVPPSIADAVVGKSETTTGSGPFARTLLLSAQVAVTLSEIAYRGFEELRGFDLRAVAESQECLEAEVQAHRVRYFLVWAWNDIGLKNTETR